MVVFVHLTPASGAPVRRVLEMTEPSDAWFDPGAGQEMHKRIIIHFQDDLSEESQLTLMDVLRSSLGKERVEEISQDEANRILVMAAPPQLASTLQAQQRHAVQTILHFPPPPASGAIAVNTDDYCCLEEEQFLNDVIIDFYLKYLVSSRLAEPDRRRTHVFSSFFYKRLTTRPSSRHGRRPAEDSLRLSAAQKRHARVKGWTKNVDIFDMDFLIVPINEHSHWFLAIICFPGLEGYRRLSDDQPCEAPQPRRARRPSAAAAPPPPAAPAAVVPAPAPVPTQVGNTLIVPLPAEPLAEQLDDSDRDEAEPDDEELDAELDEPCEPAAAADEPAPADTDAYDCELEAPIPAVCTKDVPETAIKQPCVLIFDSLAGASRSRVVATLRDYLRVEYSARKAADRPFSKDTMKACCAKVPQQTNFSDCGVYVLQYVESFFQNPVLDFHVPLLPLQHWFPLARLRRKREQLARLIERLSRRQNPERTLSLPRLLFNSAAPPPTADGTPPRPVVVARPAAGAKQVAMAPRLAGHEPPPTAKKVLMLTPAQQGTATGKPVYMTLPRQAGAGQRQAVVAHRQAAPVGRAVVAAQMQVVTSPCRPVRL
ncbi:sentrin-specific protease 6-like [Pollicipes pollicipes]|uniref:sentrin-specific protease 6-like n=1 Tax=Pollicipes pollicipes TaxID=41117 RepID=UPI0018855D97|nr:sentrin-specific protease 6-like [Pollicipes pollicipes]